MTKRNGRVKGGKQTRNYTLCADCVRPLFRSPFCRRFPLPRAVVAVEITEVKYS